MKDQVIAVSRTKNLHVSILKDSAGFQYTVVRPLHWWEKIDLETGLVKLELMLRPRNIRFWFVAGLATVLNKFSHALNGWVDILMAQAQKMLDEETLEAGGQDESESGENPV